MFSKKLKQFLTFRGWFSLTSTRHSKVFFFFKLFSKSDTIYLAEFVQIIQLKLIAVVFLIFFIFLLFLNQLSISLSDKCKKWEQ